MTGKPAAIGALWLGIQVVWGAILGISLQARTTELGVQNPITAYAIVAACGATLAAITQVVVGFLSDRRRSNVGHRREFYIVGIADRAARADRVLPHSGLRPLSSLRSLRCKSA